MCNLLKTGGNPVYRYPEWMGFDFFSGRAFIAACRNWSTLAGRLPKAES
jgi:hypothetical protein